MIGNHLVNYDTKKVSYDFSTNIPFLGQFTITRQHLETALKFFDMTGKDSTPLKTLQLDGIHVEMLDFKEMPSLIKKIETLLDDLRELKEKVDADPKPSTETV